MATNNEPHPGGPRIKGGLSVPHELEFSELQLELEGLTERLLFRPEPLATLAAHNRLDPAAVLANEDHCAWLIAGFYLIHRERGGDVDDVAEEILRRIVEQPYIEH